MDIFIRWNICLGATREKPKKSSRIRPRDWSASTGTACPSMKLTLRENHQMSTCYLMPTFSTNGVSITRSLIIDPSPEFSSSYPYTRAGGVSSFGVSEVIIFHASHFNSLRISASGNHAYEPSNHHFTRRQARLASCESIRKKDGTQFSSRPSASTAPRGIEKTWETFPPRSNSSLN